MTGTYLSEIASIGEYVNYDPTSGGNVTEENTTYTSANNGYGSQTFSTSNYKNSGGRWRVLDIDESGAITLISDSIYPDSGSEMGTQTYSLNGAIGYLYGERELHKISAIYGHGEGADTSRTITYYYGGPDDEDGSITEGTVETQQGRKTTIDLESGARSITIEDINELCGLEEKYSKNYSEYRMNYLQLTTPQLLSAGRYDPWTSGGHYVANSYFYHTAYNYLVFSDYEGATDSTASDIQANLLTSTSGDNVQILASRYISFDQDMWSAYRCYN